MVYCIVEFIADRSDRLDKYLAAQLPEYSRTRLVKAIDEGVVLVNGQSQKSRFQLAPGMVITLPEPTPTPAHDLTPAEIPLDIVFEDAHMLVVNKPRGLAAHPALSLKEPSLVNALLSRKGDLSHVAGDFRPGIVHRLDKDTTGLMVVAKNDQAHVHLARQIEEKTAERRYFAVTAGRHDQTEFVVDAPIGRDRLHRQKMAVELTGKRAISYVVEVARLERGMLYAVRLGTGRTHQIRVHLMAVGIPVLGDKIYAPKELQDVPLQLHAGYLALDHPVTGERLTFYAQPPSDFLGHEQATRQSIESLDSGTLPQASSGYATGE